MTMCGNDIIVVRHLTDETVVQLKNFYMMISCENCITLSGTVADVCCVCMCEFPDA